MRYLTVEHALAAHARLAPTQNLKAGGEHQLASALARPATSYGGQELYPDIFHKAAALLEGIAQNHPFTDGNKRTAYTCTVLFLYLNGWCIDRELTDDQQVQFVVSAADHTLDFEQMAEQLEQWARPL